MRRNTRWRVNRRIRAPKLRVIGDNGKQIGILKREEALAKAKKKGLDLVEIAPNAKPPVVKIIEFGKFLYKQEKKKRAQKKASKASEIKEVRFSPFIADNDYETRIERIKEFLAKRHKIRLVVKFKGRQMGAKKFGYELIDRILADLGETAKIDRRPKFIGRHLTAVISPTSKKIKKKG